MCAAASPAEDVTRWRRACGQLPAPSTRLLRLGTVCAARFYCVSFNLAFRLFLRTIHLGALVIGPLAHLSFSLPGCLSIG
jgi:hypothetical protein